MPKTMAESLRNFPIQEERISIVIGGEANLTVDDALLPVYVYFNLPKAKQHTRVRY